MRKIACLPDDDRRELFRNTADKMGLNDAIVEKDFWVCFTLDYLFHRCPWKDSITFKGGTSLSKAFNLISRFSEDIDLTYLPMAEMTKKALSRDLKKVEMTLIGDCLSEPINEERSDKNKSSQVWMQNMPREKRLRA